MTAEEPTPTFTRKQGCLLLIGTLPVLLVMSHLWGFDRGFTSWAFFGLLLAAVIARWYLRGHSSYWIAAAVLAVLHVPIVVYYPWHGSGQGFIPFAILDFAIDFGSLGLVGKVLLRRERRSGAP